MPILVKYHISKRPTIIKKIPTITKFDYKLFLACKTYIPYKNTNYNYLTIKYVYFSMCNTYYN